MTVWCPQELGASLSRDDVEARIVPRTAPGRPGGRHQTIGADAASPPDAELLGVPVGSPTLVVERITRTERHRPVLVSEHVFPAHRMTFSIDVPLDAGMLDPAGMKVVTGD